MKKRGRLGWPLRVDFLVQGVAVEVAVRGRTAAKDLVSVAVNMSEIKKLTSYDGKRLLVLFDFSRRPRPQEELEEEFRNWREFAGPGRPPRVIPAFTVAYYFMKTKKPISSGTLKLNVRVKRIEGVPQIEANEGVTEDVTGGPSEGNGGTGRSG
jgi:hypothetical protein